MVLDGAPVAAVEAITADQVERSRDVAALPLSHDEQTPVPHDLAEQREESPVEVRPAPLARAGVHVKVEKGIPMLLADVGPHHVLDCDAGGKCLRALFAHRLALARGERREEVVERAVALVMPMELLVRALQKA